MVTCGKATSHQPTDTSSSPKGSSANEEQSHTPYSAYKDGQFHGGLLHKSPRGYPLTFPLHAHVGTSEVVHSSSDMTTGAPSIQERERHRRCTLTGSRSANRVVPPPSHSPTNNKYSGHTSHRPVCIPSQPPASNRLHTSRSSSSLGVGLPEPRLDRPPVVRFFPISLLPRVLQKMKRQNCKITLVAPLWPRQV